MSTGKNNRRKRRTFTVRGDSLFGWHYERGVWTPIPRGSEIVRAGSGPEPIPLRPGPDGESPPVLFNIVRGCAQPVLTETPNGKRYEARLLAGLKRDGGGVPLFIADGPSATDLIANHRALLVDYADMGIAA